MIKGSARIIAHVHEVGRKVAVERKRRDHRRPCSLHHHFSAPSVSVRWFVQSSWLCIHTGEHPSHRRHSALSRSPPQLDMLYIVHLIPHRCRRGGASSIFIHFLRANTKVDTNINRYSSKWILATCDLEEPAPERRDRIGEVMAGQWKKALRAVCGTALCIGTQGAPKSESERGTQSRRIPLLRMQELTDLCRRSRTGIGHAPGNCSSKGTLCDNEEQ